MENRKLELKDVSGYLPYGMRFQEQKYHTILRMDSIESRNSHQIWATQKYIKGVKDVNDINYLYLSARNCSGEGFRMKDIKPALHPMSDLIKSIAVKGYNKNKEFIPLIELAKYDTGNEGLEYELKRNTDPSHADYYISITIKGNPEPCIYSFSKNAEYEGVSMWELDFLNQWMFDYRGLIDAHIAIDINKINEL